MTKKLIIQVMILIFMILPGFRLHAQSQVNPVDQDTWILNFGLGAGNNYWGNGTGFGPGMKVAFEKGMWKVGPGVFTLGGEMGFSYFWHNWSYYYEFQDIALKESWINIMFGARSAYHIGFNVKGLDVYGGIPLGIGFSLYNYSGWDNTDNWKSWGGYSHHPVYPYVGVFFGGSYFFNNVLGINAEFGYNATYAQVGLVFILD
jgi:hypothetical protein